MKKGQKQALAVGAGLAAIAAAAAGVYMMTGKNAKNRKKVAKWVGDMQKDVVTELNKAGKATKATYNKVVDTAVKNYEGLKNVSTAELALAAADLKNSWDSISAELNAASKAVSKVVPKTAKSLVKTVTAKKSAKKTTAKASQKKAVKKSKK